VHQVSAACVLPALSAQINPNVNFFI